MKFSRVYKESKLFWPSTVFVGDGELREGGGGFFPTLSEVWRNAELSGEKWSEWHQLMVWAIFGGYHDLAIQALKEGKTHIHKKDLNAKSIEKTFSENLFTPTAPCYPRQMKRAYKNDLKP